MKDVILSFLKHFEPALDLDTVDREFLRMLFERESSRAEADMILEALEAYSELEVERELEEIRSFENAQWRRHYLRYEASLATCIHWLQSDEHNSHSVALNRIPTFLLGWMDLSKLGLSDRIEAASRMSRDTVLKAFSADPNSCVRRLAVERCMEVPYDMLKDESSDVRLAAFTRLPVVDRDAAFEQEKDLRVRTRCIIGLSREKKLQVIQEGDVVMRIEAIRGLKPEEIPDSVFDKYQSHISDDLRATLASKVNSLDCLNRWMKAESSERIRRELSKRTEVLTRRELDQKEQVEQDLEELQKVVSGALRAAGLESADPKRGLLMLAEHFRKTQDATAWVAGKVDSRVKIESRGLERAWEEEAQKAARGEEKSATLGEGIEDGPTVAGTIASGVASAFAERLAGPKGALVTQVGRDIYISSRVEEHLRE